MDAERWIVLLVLGGLAGALGQLGRVIIGLKKVADEAAAAGKTYSDLLDPARLLMSIAIGFTAGALAAVLAKNVTDPQISLEQILAFAGAGYAGADFIEGAMRSGVPGSTGMTGAATGSVTGDGYMG